MLRFSMRMITAFFPMLLTAASPASADSNQAAARRLLQCPAFASPVESIALALAGYLVDHAFEWRGDLSRESKKIMRRLEKVGEPTAVQKFWSLLADADATTRSYLMWRLMAPIDATSVRWNLREDDADLAAQLNELAASPPEVIQENAFFNYPYRSELPRDDEIVVRVALRLLARIAPANVANARTRSAARTLAYSESADPAIDAALAELVRDPASGDSTMVSRLAQLELWRLRRQARGFSTKNVDPKYLARACAAGETTAELLSSILNFYETFGFAKYPDFDRVVYAYFQRQPGAFANLPVGRLRRIAAKYRADYGIGAARN